MPFKVNVDFAGDPNSPAPMTVEQGRSFSVAGWAFDPETFAVPRAGYVIVDGALRFAAQMIWRPDVARHFENELVTFSGFDATFSSDVLATGPHEFKVLLQEQDGRWIEVGRGNFQVVPAANEQYRRILVAAQPKSGSTYLSYVLREYFGIPVAPMEFVYQDWEHNFEPHMMTRLRSRPWVMQMHVRPYEPNVRFLEDENVTLILSRRNLADTIVSMDDQIRLRSGFKRFFYINDAAFLAMPDQERYQFLIRYGLPWYVSFYCGWRKFGARFNPIVAHYELLASDPFAYFTEVLKALGEEAIDDNRLREILDRKLASRVVNMNVGRNSRSAGKFSDETKAMLEDFLRHHFEPLDELLEELPWRKETSIAP